MTDEDLPQKSGNLEKQQVNRLKLLVKRPQSTWFRLNFGVELKQLGMKTKIITVIITAMVLASCGTSKTVVSAEELNKVNAIIESDTLTIESVWAYPQNQSTIINTRLLPPESAAGNINLQGNENYFKKIGDSLSFDLPFFGVRQMGAAYDIDKAGFTFDGLPDEFEHTFDEKKSVHQYKIEVNNSTENLQMIIKIFANLNTEIRVNSSHRSSIAYRGKIVQTDTD